MSRWRFPLFLIALGLLIRIFYLWGNTIPYMFDHARDSIEVMDFLRTGSPPLIGPRASIDGLFFGPGWYYLIAPFYWLGAGHPLSPVGAVLLLYVLEVFLAYKYFGKWPAVMMTLTPGWWWIALSAWNPFPLAFISLAILILLKQSREQQQVSLKQAALLGLLSGFGFHFSTAYAMFYPVIIAIFLWYQKSKWNWRQFLMYAFCFGLPWLPQAAFEIRHDFIEVRAILAYLHTPSAVEFSLVKAFQTIGTICSTLFWANMPGSAFFDQHMSLRTGLGVVFALVFLLLFIRQFFRKKTTSQTPPNLLLESWLFILIPSLAYLFLHFSLWYVVGMYPAGAYIVSHYFSKLHKKYKLALILLYIAGAIFAMGQHFYTNRQVFLTGRNFLPAKLQAVKKVRELSHGQAFASYQFVPEVYDYTYQYLYYWQAEHGWPLPVEFSYAPNQPLYYPQKPELLATFGGDVPLPGTKPMYLFYIVEKPEYQNVLDEWWAKQQPHKVIKEVEISPELKIYQAIPE